jgi:DNA-binding CsgD family transcriptional regulator
MNLTKYFLLTLFLVTTSFCLASSSENPLLQKGWDELVKDNENKAFGYFWEAHEKAVKEKNIADKAESLFYLGICSYGSSLEKGLQFATKSLSEYKNLEKSNPKLAQIGRNKCLQLISTIYSRQKKYHDAIRLSKEVVTELKDKNDSSGTLGLAYNSLGSIYEIKKRSDSTEYYYKLALIEFEKHNSSAYLPISYCKMGELAQQKKQKDISFNFFNKALALAKKTKNLQAQVIALIALGKWNLDLNSNVKEAEKYFTNANQIAQKLTDKTFEIKSIDALIETAKKQGNYQKVSQLQNQIIQIKDSFYSFEREQIVKSLEVQFEVAEKNRKLELVSAEKEVTKLTNLLLIGLIMLLLIVFGILYIFLKRINRRDKQLLKTKEDLVLLMEEQKKMKEQQFQNDIEYKESQLSAITIQMVEKNELLDEIKSIINSKEPNSESQLKRIVNKYTVQENNWKDFDHYFESVNKNFYTRLKQKYPEISGNDLKICALIKLNLSIKEMATILNISPDSVKTARHRLRKKLQLSTEENLTDFILSV